MKTSKLLAPLAIAFALVTGCSQILNLDQFNGASLDQADSTAADALNDGAPGDDATEPDASPTDVLSAEASDGTVKPDSSPIDALAEAADGSGQPDSLAEAGDGAASTADADGGSVESSIPPDAADGGDAGEAGVEWCVAMANSGANYALCRDFDDGKSYAYLFTPNINLVPAGTAPTISNTVSDSPPNSVLFILPILAACRADGGTACSEQIQLNANVLPDVAHPLVRIAFAVNLVNYDANNVHDLSLAAISYNEGAYAVSWDLQGTGSTVFETTLLPDGGVGSTIQQAAALPPLSQWVNVVLTLDIGGQTVSLAFNGTPALTTPITAPVISGNATVTVGVNKFVGPTTPLSLYLDNVLISTN
jgi:hypothetical protein